MASILPQGRRGGYDERRRAGKMDLVAARTANYARYTASAALVIAPSSGASASARADVETICCWQADGRSAG